MGLLRKELYKCISSRVLWIVLAALLAVCFLVTGIRSAVSVRDRDVRAVYDWTLEHPQEAEDYRQACLAEWTEHRNEEDYRIPAVLAPSGETDDLTLLNAVLQEQERIRTQAREPDRQIAYAEERLAELEYFGFGPGSYAVRAMEMHKSTYESVRNQPVDTHRLSFGYDRYLGEQAVPIYTIAFGLFAAAYLFVSDRAGGLGPVLLATRKGRRAASATRAAALAISASAAGLLFCACAGLSVGVFCGYSSCLDPIQAVGGCAGVPYPVTILGYLFLHTAERVFGIGVLTMAAGCAASLSGSYAVTLLCGAGFFGVQEWLFLTETGPSGGLMNLAAAADSTRLLSFFRTVNVFGRPLSVPAAVLLLVGFCGLLALSGILVPSGPLRRVPGRDERRIGLIGRIAGIRTSRHKGGVWSSLWRYEACRIRMPVLAAALVCLLGIQWVLTASGSARMQTYPEAVYYRYIQSYNACPDETSRQTFLLDERERFDGILNRKEDMDREFENGTVPAETYREYIVEWRKAYGEQAVFSRVEEYIRYLQGQQSRRGQTARAVYSSGYDAYWVAGTDFAAALLWLLIVLFCDTGNDRYAPGGGLTPVIRATRKGRRRAELVRMALCAGMGGMGSLMLRCVRLGSVLSAVPMEDAAQPAWTIPLFGQLQTSLPLAGCIAADLALSLTGGALFCFAASRLAVWIRSVWITGGIVLIALCLPEVLYRVAFSRSPWVSALSFISPARFFQDITDESALRVCLLYLGLWGLAAVLAPILSYCGIFGKKVKKGWN